MKKKASAVLASLTVLMLVLIAAGCGSKPSLDEWYSDNKAMFDEEVASIDPDISGYTYEVMVIDSNVLLYKRTLLMSYPTDADNLAVLTEVYDAQFDTYKIRYSQLLEQMKEETGTKNIVIRLAAFNPDGTELYSRDYTE